MSDIRVNCSHCGHVIDASDKLAGQGITCPQCGKQLVVPASGARSEGAAKLQVKHGSGIDGARRCPSCESAMPPEAVICLQCGYDTRTGSRYLDSPQKSPMLQWILWGFGLIILAGLAKTFLFQGRTDEGQASVTPPTQQAPAGAVSDAGVVAPGADETQPAAGVSTAQPPAMAAMPKKISEDTAKLEAEYRVTLNEQLAKTYPMYAPGDSVVLRRVNGLVHRGTLVVLKPDIVVVAQEGLTNEVPLKVLDRASRLKCDPAFRSQVVDFHVQKRVHEFADF